MVPRPMVGVMQAWVTLRADDPEAASAWSIGRTLDARLVSLRRSRLIEIHGSSLDVAAALALLHASTQFYNPHKQRCVVRARAGDPIPGDADPVYVAVWERGGERRRAAERWWLHETGDAVEVHEATVWELRSDPPSEREAVAVSLTLLRDARHGLFCNPWSQEFRTLGHDAAPPWIVPAAVSSQKGDAP